MRDPNSKVVSLAEKLQLEDSHPHPATTGEMLPAGLGVITQARGPAGRPGITRAEGMSAPGIVHPIKVKSQAARVSADAPMAVGNMRTQDPGSTGGT